MYRNIGRYSTPGGTLLPVELRLRGLGLAVAVVIGPAAGLLTLPGGGGLLRLAGIAARIFTRLLGGVVNAGSPMALRLGVLAASVCALALVLRKRSVCR